jgi:hypothetical protein
MNDHQVYELAARMTYREMDDEIRRLNKDVMTTAELDRVHLLMVAQAQWQINRRRRG